MTCGNPINHMFINNVRKFIFSFSIIQKDSDLYGDLSSIGKPRDADDVMECMQFGICDVHPKSLSQIWF